MEELIDKFMSEIKSKLTDVQIDYYYDEEMDIWFIRHNMDIFNNKNVAYIVGKLIKEMFFEKGIFNIALDYNFEL